MVKRVPRRNIDSVNYKNFLQVSKKFYEGAELASEHKNYNSAGVLIVHAAIALADAVTIRYSSLKATGDSHYEIIKLLQETAPVSRETKSAVSHFERIIDHKNAVSYRGNLYMKEDYDQLLKHYLRFSSWAEIIVG